MDNDNKAEQLEIRFPEWKPENTENKEFAEFCRKHNLYGPYDQINPD